MTSTEPNCPCDVLLHPQPLSIDAGLSTIPRQIATFPEFRRAMLAAIPTQPALAQWRARGDQDLGVMLIEMWAYVCDVLAFYDETIAQEGYLRTAKRDPSVRMLVGLLGYRPRPAVAAQVRLAIKADGRLPIMLPVGLAVRSSAFGSEPPQTFELDADTRAHPLLNGWKLAPTRPTTIRKGARRLLLAPDSATARTGDHLLLFSGAGAAPTVHTAKDVAKFAGVDGVKYVRIKLGRKLSAPVDIAGSRLLRPASTTGLWAHPASPFSPAPGTDKLVLSGLTPQVKPGDWLIASTPSARAAFQVTAVSQVQCKVAGGQSIGSIFTLAINVTPTVYATTTAVTISPKWPASLGADGSMVAVQYGLQPAGVLTAELDARIAADARLTLLPPIEAPPDGTRSGRFLVSDADATSTELAGGVDFGARVLTPTQGSGLTTELDPPAEVYGNLGDFSRGETVSAETLGVGDASLANQSFTLKKAPLTYLPSLSPADENGVRSTLAVWVGGVQWREVPSFYGVDASSTVYHVRQNDAGASTVTFGDGVRGARLPSGATVVGRYRFGAGAVSPPAGGLTQLAKPVKGLTSILNPVAAAGGADRQQAAQVRTFAPRSALLFGRAVSITDVEALAAGQPGVLGVQARWTWDDHMQQPAIQVWYLGAPAIATTVLESLRAATAPGTPIRATSATAIPVSVAVTVRVDPAYQAAAVGDAVLAALTAPGTGALAPEVIGVGAAVFRSRLLADIVAVAGVSAVDGLLWQNASFAEYGKTPGDGAWFQVTPTVTAVEG
jgi:hypothetical protein